MVPKIPVVFLFLCSLSLYQTPGFCSDQDNAPVSLYKIKGIWTDSWGNPHHTTNANFNRDEIANNGTGKVAVSLVWLDWDTDGSLPPAVLLPGQEVYQGELFKIDPEADDEIKFYSERGIEVTAVLFGTPSRFRVSGCLPSMAEKAIFCESSSNGLNSFGRFAGMLARRYDGTRGNGRIKNFVIGNEVNRSEYYHIAGGYTGDRDTVTRRWVDSYAGFFKAAYDNIQSNQPTAKVFVPLDHAFSASRWDNPIKIAGAGEPSLSTQTFLTEFAARMEGRTWRVAYHPYNTDLFSPAFDPNDAALSGTVSLGNIGLLPGWLRKTFPNSPEVYGDIMLTESGFHSGSPVSSDLAQAVALSRSFRNVLATPGITGYIYQRMVDHPDEGGLLLGLRRILGEAKLSWYVWTLMNRSDILPLHSGFELLPFTKLVRGYHPTENRRWFSSRLLPPGFIEEISWKLLRAPSPTREMRMLYEYGPASGEHTFLSENPIVDPACVGQEPRGPVGYLYTNPASGLVPLYRCYNSASRDYLISQNPGGEGGYVGSPRLLGYAYHSTATVPFLESNPSALFFIPSPVATLKPPPAPNAPSFLTAAPGTHSQINLSWTGNSNNETGFKVYGSPDGVNFSLIGTPGADVHLFSHTGLLANTLYFYKVRAFNAGGDSANSSAVSARTAPLEAPSGLTAVVVSNSQINLSWVDNSNNETGFKVYLVYGSGIGFLQIGTTGAGVTLFSHTGLSANIGYAYIVRAFNASGDSANSNTVYTGTAPPSAPSGLAAVVVSNSQNVAPVSARTAPLEAPSGLTAVVISNSQINLSWVDNSNNETSFKIQRQGSIRASPLYRLHNEGAQSHFYTASLAEKNALIGAGLRDEGICGYILPNPARGLSALYRLYNPISGGHFYTASLAERNAQIAAGLRDEGVAGYLYPNSVSGTIPLYRLYRNDPQRGRHLYTTSWEELVNLLQLPGWQYEGITGHVAASSVIEEENWTDLAVVPANRVLYEDRSVQAGLSYRYRVRATNSDGDSTDAVSGRVLVTTATGFATQQPRSVALQRRTSRRAPRAS